MSQGPGTGQLRVTSYRQSNIGDDDFQNPLDEESFMPEYPKFNRNLSPADVKKIVSAVPKLPPAATQTSISTVFNVHIDSRQRALYPENILEDEIINLEPYPLVFENGSPILTILIDNHNLRVGDDITLGNVVSKNLTLIDALTIKNKSMYVRINQTNHGMSLFGRYDPSDSTAFVQAPFTDKLPSVYNPNSVIPDTIVNYVLIQPSNLYVTFTGIKGPNDSSTIGSIPTNYLNQTLQVVLLFNLVGGIYVLNKNAYLIKLLIPSTINYENTGNTINVLYSNLFGVPIAIINSGTPNSVTRQTVYYQIIESSSESIKVRMTTPAIVDPFCPFYAFSDNLEGLNNFIISEGNRGGGPSIYLQKIRQINPGYPHPNAYVIRLNNNYRNISQVRMTSSVFPNSFRIINVTNNKLYWRNLSDGDQIYYLTVQPGNYAPCQFATLLQQMFSVIPRPNYCIVPDLPIVDSSLLKLIDPVPYSPEGNYKYQDVDVSIDPSTSIVTFKTWRKIKLIDPLYIPQTVYEVNIEIDYLYFGRNLYMKKKNMELNTEIAIIIDFFHDTYQDFMSINTETTLETFSFNSNEVIIPNHSLKIGDLFWTDRFNTSKPFFYQIIQIINPSKFVVVKNSEIRMIYKDYLLDSNGFSESTLEIKPIPAMNQFMWVTQPNNNLQVGNEIRIEGSLGVNGACPEVVNGCFKINRIINKDTYEVILPSYVACNIDSENNIVIIRYPDIFQLFFNFPDTFGKLLSFKRPGEPLSITPYSSTIRNIDPYQRDFNFTPISSIYRPSNPPLLMTGDTYFYMICPELGVGVYQNTQYYQTNGEIVGANTVFAKIQITENPGDYMVNSYVPVIKVFPSLTSISELSFRFVNPDGTDVDFQDADHTFVLEFTVVNSVPVKTNVDTNIDSIVGPRTLNDFGLTNLRDARDYDN